MLAASVFIDTNALLYVHDRRNPDKAAIAEDWMRKGITTQQICVNLQVLNEMANALFRKRWFSSATDVFAIVDRFAEIGDTPVGWTEITRAREIHATTRYSWWDCLLLASALELGCSHFLSEDLQDGHQIGGLTVINPFLHAPETILGPLQD